MNILFHESFISLCLSLPLRGLLVQVIYCFSHIIRHRINDLIWMRYVTCVIYIVYVRSTPVIVCFFSADLSECCFVIGQTYKSDP